jgi:uncharacterized protein (DUF1015 family)
VHVPRGTIGAGSTERAASAEGAAVPALDEPPLETAAGIFATMILEQALGWQREEAIGDGRLAYATEWRQALATVYMGHYQCACLLPPTPASQVAAWALTGRTMPPKSTFFYPKVPTGLVFHLFD